MTHKNTLFDRAGMRNTSCKSRIAGTMLAFAALLALLPGSVEATSIWLGSGADDFWSTAGNWSGGVPTEGGTNGNIVAYFLSATGLNGTAVTVSNTNTLSAIDFSGTAFNGLSGMTISATSGGTLNLDSYNNSGIIIDPLFTGSGITESVTAPIVAGLGTQASLYFANYSLPSANDTLQFGSISSSISSGTYTLFMGGFGNSAVTGSISNGTAGGTVALDFIQSGTWTLSGSNSYTGNTAIQGGTVVVNYLGSNTTAGISTGTLTLGNLNYGGIGGGALVLNGNSSGATVQQVAGLIDNVGANSIQINPGAGQTASLVDTGTFSRAKGSTLDVTLGTGASLVISGTNGIVTSGTGSNTVMVGVTFGGTTWGTLSGTNIVAYSGGFSNAWTSGSNVQVASSLTGVSGSANSLLFNQASSNTIAVATGSTANISSGEILVASSVGANNTLITGGMLTTGVAELIVNQDDASGTLTIASNIGSTNALTKSGAGTLVLSGTDTYSGVTTINQGLIQAGSTGALGANTVVDFNGPTAGLDLDGNNISVESLETTGASWSSTTLANDGVLPYVTNSKAGTEAILTITNGAQGIQRKGITLNQGAGAALGLDITGGVMSFGFYGYNATNITSSTGVAIATETQNYILLYGPVLLQGGGLNGGTASFNTMGATVLSNASSYLGSASTAAGNGITYSTGFLGGTAGIINNGGVAVMIDDTGSVLDDVTALTMISGGITEIGTGTLSMGLMNTTVGSVYSAGYIQAAGAGTIVTAGMSGTASDSLRATGEGTIIVTGTSGVVAGNSGTYVATAGLATATYGMNIYGGLIDIAPSGSNAAITVSGLVSGNSGAAIVAGGGGTLELNKGLNTSLNFVIGNSTSGSTPMLVRSGYGTLNIEAASGLSSFGTASGESLTILGTGSALPVTTNGILAPYIVASDSTSYATFVGAVTTGGTSSTLVQATYTDTNFANSGSTQVETVSVGSTANIGSGSTTYAYALQDNGVLNIGSSGTLRLGYGAAGSQGGLILNGGEVLGGALTAGAGELLIYSSTGGGAISSNIVGTAANGSAGLTVFGPGTLYLTGSLGYGGVTTIDSGVLDISYATGAGGVTGALPAGGLSLEDGVLQTNGLFTRSLYTTANSLVSNGYVAWTSTGMNGGSGGFSADNGPLTVSIGGVGTATELVWGSQGFVAEGGVLMFGSVTSNGEVNFENPVDLGAYNDNSYYSRIISVTANSGDVLNGIMPTALGGGGTGTFNGDYTVMSGVISCDNGDGLTKSGNGILELTGANTYTGPTSITGGILAVNNDGNLGTAPTAAYTLVSTAGETGYTLTPGAVQIDGGTLEWMSTGTMNANRTILLGPVGNIGVAPGQTLTFNGQISDYINEHGSLNKVDTGTLILGGISSYTGATTVSAGSLLIAAGGSLGSSPVTVAGGATLGAGGSASGGASLSTLNVASLTLSGSSALSLYLNPSSTVSDTILATSLTLNGGNIVLALNAIGSLTGSAYTLLTWNNTALKNVTSDFTVTFDGTAGAPTGYSLQEVDGTTSNSLELVAAVPEPATWTLMGAGSIVLLWSRRNKTRLRKA